MDFASTGCKAILRAPSAGPGRARMDRRATGGVCVIIIADPFGPRSDFTTDQSPMHDGEASPVTMWAFAGIAELGGHALSDCSTHTQSRP